MFPRVARRYQAVVKTTIGKSSSSDKASLMRQNSGQNWPLTIWQGNDDLYPSLTAYCTYEPLRFTITVRHTVGSQKSISFDQTVGPAFKVHAEDRNRFFELAILLADQMAAELGLHPLEP